MKNAIGVALGVLGLLAAGAASAADIGMPAVAGPVVVVARPVEAGFDWSRVYVGAQAGTWFELDPLTFNSYRASVMLGRNFVLGDRLVVGAEAVTGFYVNAPDGILFDAMGMGRAGLLLGDRLLAYGTVGFGFDFGAVDGGAFMVAGGGVEVGVGAHLGLRTEVIAFRYLGAPFSFVSGTVGLHWYFGR